MGRGKRRSRVYSTYHRDLVELPEPPQALGVYTCGPTVYQRIHVGNARPYVISLWLKRYLEAEGHTVTLVENVTDVNDKIYAAAPGASAALAEQAADWYREDTDLLGLGRPDHEPKATEAVPKIIALVEELVESGHAYAVQGDVYFSVRSFPDYGRLSGQRPDEVEEQEPNPLKRDPRDFALWKGHKEGEDTWWESPWGRGRPGWHIECSAMAEALLGPSFDIHIGGIDLRFPHHENELAQSRALGREFAHVWMHNGLLEIDGAKMAKSEGNDISLKGAVERWGRETLLLLFLSGHWRRPLDYSERTLAQAKAQAERFKNAFVGWEGQPGALDERLLEALADDFNTPEALALMHQWASEGRLDLLYPALELFGLQSLAARAEAPPEVVVLAEERKAARAQKDYAASDRLRAEIAALGWEVRDAGPDYELLPLSQP